MKLNYLQLLIVAAVVFAIGTPVLCQTKKGDNISVPFGKSTILIPTPEGLHEISNSFEAVTATYKASEPPVNDLIAAYVADSDLQRLQRNEQPLMQYYAKISTLKELREQHASSSLFEAVVADFRKHTDTYLDTDQPALKKLVKDMEQRMSQNSSGPANLDIGKPKNLGAFNVSANVYSVLLLSAVKLQVGDKEGSRMVLAAASLIHVKNRILFVNAYRTYESEADLQTLKEAVKKWTSSILAANAVSKTPAAR